MGKKVGRFIKMIFIQKHRAIKLGWDEYDAEIIGYAKALQGAIWKRGRWGSKKSFKSSYSKTESKKENEMEDLTKLRKIKEFNIFKDEAGRFYLSRRTEIKHNSFNKEMSKYGDEVIKRLESWAEEIIEKTDEDILKVDSYFYNKVWKVHRDDNIFD